MNKVVIPIVRFLLTSLLLALIAGCGYRSPQPKGVRGDAGSRQPTPIE